MITEYNPIMLLKRKIYSSLLKWKEKEGKTALLVEGARRVGKSTIAEEFAKNEYKSYIIIDFSKCTSVVKNAFLEQMSHLDVFFQIMSIEYGVELVERNTLFIFDEVQLFPKAREAIKHLVADGRFDYLETGSLISIRENVENIPLRHFVWNIAERLGKRDYTMAMRIAFIKALFPKPFEGLDYSTLKNLKAPCSSDVIPIDEPVNGGYKFHDVTEETSE